MIPKIPALLIAVGVLGSGWGLSRQAAVQQRINHQTLRLATVLSNTHGLVVTSNRRLNALTQMTAGLSQMNQQLSSTVNQLTQAKNAMAILLKEQTAIAEELTRLNQGLGYVHEDLNNTAHFVTSSNRLTEGSIRQVSEQVGLLRELAQQTQITIQELAQMAQKTALLRHLNQSLP